MRESHGVESGAGSAVHEPLPETIDLEGFFPVEYRQHAVQPGLMRTAAREQPFSIPSFFGAVFVLAVSPYAATGPMTVSKGKNGIPRAGPCPPGVNPAIRYP